MCLKSTKNADRNYSKEQPECKLLEVPYVAGTVNPYHLTKIDEQKIHILRDCNISGSKVYTFHEHTIYDSDIFIR